MITAFGYISQEHLDQARKSIGPKHILEQEEKINEFVSTLSISEYRDRVVAKDLMMKGYLLGFIKLEEYSTF